MSEFRTLGDDNYLWQIEIRYLMTDLMIRNPSTRRRIPRRSRSLREHLNQIARK